jgi:hypothetical protein
MKPTIDNITNPQYHVGSMPALAENFLLSLPTTTLISNSSGKAACYALAVGSTRQECLAYLEQRNITSISFAHWLAVPALQLLLVFRGQQCIAVEQQLLTP